MAARQKQKPDTWRKRRAFMFVTIAFCMSSVVYVLWRGLDTGAAETAVSMSFVIIGTTVASYVFGAAWEDIKNFEVRSNDDPDFYKGDWPGSQDGFKGDD